MIVSYSLIIAVLLFNLAMVIIALLRRWTGYLAKYSTTALVLLAVFGAMRVVLPFSFPFTHVVSSYELIPSIRMFFRTDVWPGAGSLELYYLILIIWAAGSLVMLFRITRSTLQVLSYQRRYRTDESAEVDRIVQKNGFRNTKIVVSPDVVVPYVAGFFKARIYLPRIELDDNALGLILKHEYQHFKSKDVLIKAFYLLLSVIFWWNPIVHLFLRELDKLLEIRCDAVVTKRMNENEKTLYMESLLYIARHIQSKETASHATASAFVQAGQYGFLEQRFHLIKTGENAKSGIMQAISIALIVFIFTTSYFVIIQPAYMPLGYNTGEVFSITPENAYIVATLDGRYELYIFGQFVEELEEELLSAEYFVILDIIEESDLSDNDNNGMP